MNLFLRIPYPTAAEPGGRGGRCPPTFEKVAILPPTFLAVEPGGRGTFPPPPPHTHTFEKVGIFPHFLPSAI